MSAFKHIYEQLFEDASFLWILHSAAANRPNYCLHDLAELEQRINRQLAALMTMPELTWDLCLEFMPQQQPEYLFVAAFFAFNNQDIQQIQQCVEQGLVDAAGTKALASALAWLPSEVSQPWLKKFLVSKDLQHKHLAIWACSLRREDPFEYLAPIVNRTDCRAYAPLFARALRLIGELKYRNLMPILPAAIQSDNDDIKFWALWAMILLGDKSAAQQLQSFVFESNDYQLLAINVAFSVLPNTDAQQWINSLAKNPDNRRLVIMAAASLGDPLVCDWLIGQMQNPITARLAGEAFTQITGMDLIAHKVAAQEADQNKIPNDEDDEAEEYFEDEGLPYPDAEKIAALWANSKHQFTFGARYFMGQFPEREALKKTYIEGTQRQRKVAALELALLDIDQPLLNFAISNIAR